MALAKVNTVEIVGTLAQSKLEVKTSKDGQEYISGTITVDSDIDGVKNNFEISLYAKKVTKTGEVSKLFTNYEGLAKMIGSKIRINGSMREERYFNKTAGQLQSLQKLEGRFINAENISTPDRATFEVSGFVRKPLVAKTNKKGEIYAYELEVGQANYDDSQLNNFKFQVEPTAFDIIKSIQQIYGVNTTVRFGGNIRFITVTSEVTQETGFGQPRTRVFTNTNRSFFITFGDNPIVDESTYDGATIVRLTQAYAARDVQLTADAGANSPVMGAAPISSRQTSLI